jgi:NhaP-type Na+/H+ or K+/H+ antiporter
LEYVELAAIAGVVLAYGLFSRRLEATPLTGPILFVSAGMVMGATGVFETGMDEGPVRVLAEATLVLLLFTDAIRIDLRVLRGQLELPARLLGIGLPLTVGLGVLLASWIFTGYAFWEAALVAAILSPTDAALGQAVVTNPSVPGRIRQALNVESGLNDGLMLPVITLFLALAASSVDIETPSFWVGFVARQVGFGVLFGVLVGYVGGRLIDHFATRGWIEGAARQLSTLAVGVGAFAVAEIVNGNGFVAAFVAGLAFGEAAREHCTGAYDFAEDEGQLLATLTFLFFGAVFAGPALGDPTWPILGFAILALTVMRMVPVAVSLVGSHLSVPTVAYMAWFGPRGLASILFGLFILEEADLPAGDEIFLVVTWTVILSVLLHGLTSVWLSERYGQWYVIHRRSHMPEATAVEEMPTR